MTALRRMFTEQRAEALGNLGDVVGREHILLDARRAQERYVAVARAPILHALTDSIKAGRETIAPTNPHKAEPDFISRAALAWLSRRLAWAALEVGEETAAQLSQALAAGFAAGESTDQIAARIQALGAFSAVRAQRIARTEIIAAANTGALQGYADSRVVDKVRFMVALDERTCEECMSLRDEEYTLDEAEGIIPVHPNCLLPDVRVEAAQVIAGDRAFYRGQAVEVRTENGNVLTCTPNHAILTPAGFVAAKGLRQGGYIIRCLDSQRVLCSVDPDNYHRPTPIKQVWDTLRVQRGMFGRRVPVAPVDFHGDAGAFEGQIDIVYPYGLLGRGRNPSLAQHPGQQHLCRRHAALSGLAGERSTLALSDGSVATTVSGMRGSREGAALLWSHAGEAQQIGLAPVARRDASLNQAAPDAAPVDVELARQLQLRFSGLVAPEKITHVRYREICSHVYDLQTQGRWYIANGIIAHNCRCVFTPLLAGLEAEEA